MSSDHQLPPRVAYVTTEKCYHTATVWRRPPIRLVRVSLVGGKRKFLDIEPESPRR